MTTTKHSPLPWKVFLRDESEHATDDIMSGNRRVANVYGGTADPEGIGRANAEFIVRAVNSHAALLEACKAAIEYITCGTNPARGCVSAPPADVAMQQMLSAAIAAAEER